MSQMPQAQKQPRRLPTVTLGDEEYFVDARLNQIRNVKNPIDFTDMDSLCEMLLAKYGVDDPDEIHCGDKPNACPAQEECPMNPWKE